MVSSSSEIHTSLGSRRRLDKAAVAEGLVASVVVRFSMHLVGAPCVAEELGHTRQVKPRHASSVITEERPMHCGCLRQIWARVSRVIIRTEFLKMHKLVSLLQICIAMTPLLGNIAHAQLDHLSNGETKMMATQPVNKQEAADKRKKEALDIFKKYPDAVPLGLQDKILAQQVAIGMDPYMAHLAAGAFTFRVDADPTKWGKNADPYNVMWAQSQHPDNSQIWMTFQTDTQFPGEGEERFTVHFQKGKAVKIEKLAGGKP